MMAAWGAGLLLVLSTSFLCPASCAFVNAPNSFWRPLREAGAKRQTHALHMAIDASRIRAISLDVTGTILVHRYPIMQTYAEAAKWAQLPAPPSVEELKPAFKKAYYKHLTESPCFGHSEGLSSRQWWVSTVKSVLEFCGRSYTDSEFERFFRRVYQHYGSLGKL